jgi:hypothetical protein
MDRVSRRQVIKTGVAGGAAVAGGALAGVAMRGPRTAAAAGTSGVHIHGTVVFNEQPTGFGPGEPKASMGSMPGMMRMASITGYKHVINIDVFGPDSDVSGSGWGASISADPKIPDPVDGLQCFYTQRGSIQGDVVKLTGRMLFSGDPGDPGGIIRTEANLVTGKIRWTGTANKSMQFLLEGSGVVMRI